MNTTRFYKYILVFLIIFQSVNVFANETVFVIDPPTWEIGDLASGQTASKEIHIYANNNPIKLAETPIETCDCFSGKIIKQEGSKENPAKVLLNFDTTGYRGAHTKHIIVEVLEPEAYTLRIAASVNVIAEDPLLIELFGSQEDGNLINTQEAAKKLRDIFGNQVEIPEVYNTDTIEAYKKLNEYESTLKKYAAGGAVAIIDKKHYISSDNISSSVQSYLENYFKLETINDKSENIQQEIPNQSQENVVYAYFFYQKHCIKCKIAKNKIDDIAQKNRDKLKVIYLDTSKIENQERFIYLRQKLNFKSHNMLAVISGKHFLFGSKDIVNNFENAIFDNYSKQNLTFIDFNQSIPKNPFEDYSYYAVVGVGLIDGLNPCAFATMIFFVSLMALMKKGRKDTIIVGIFFTLAVFVTYTLIGLTLINVIREFNHFDLVRSIFFYVIFGATIVLACISFFDAFIYSLTSRERRIILQMPQSLKAKIHYLFRNRLKTGNLVFAAIVCGVLVTLIETVCTGQTYIPIANIIAQKQNYAQRYDYLIIYNICFIIPLLVVFVLTVLGVKSNTLAEFSKNHLPAVKLATGFLFIGLATFMWLSHFGIIILD